MQEGRPVIIPGDGTSLWTVTFNTDFAIGYTGLMGNRHAIGEAFQITGDEMTDSPWYTVSGLTKNAYYDFRLKANGDGGATWLSSDFSATITKKTRKALLRKERSEKFAGSR